MPHSPWLLRKVEDATHLAHLGHSLEVPIFHSWARCFDRRRKWQILDMIYLGMTWFLFQVIYLHWIHSYDVMMLFMDIPVALWCMMVNLGQFIWKRIWPGNDMESDNKTGRRTRTTCCAFFFQTKVYQPGTFQCYRNAFRCFMVTLRNLIVVGSIQPIGW